MPDPPSGDRVLTVGAVGRVPGDEPLLLAPVTAT